MSLIDGARFCGSCGFTMQAEGQQVPVPPPSVVGQQQVSGGAFHFDLDGRGHGRGYNWSIDHQGAFALAIVNLGAEQSISAEAGAMVSMSSNIDLHAEMKGGVFGALKRAVGGESAFVSTFTAKGGPGEVTLAPGAPGDVAGIEMQNQTFCVQSSSYLAGDTSLVVDTKFGGSKVVLWGRRPLRSAGIRNRPTARLFVWCNTQKDVTSGRAICRRYRPFGRLGRAYAIQPAKGCKERIFPKLFEW